MSNVLIAGMTSAGKSILARRLVAGHGFSRIPGDSLVLAFSEVFPELGIAHDKEVYLEARRAFSPFVVRLMRALAWEGSGPYVLDSFHLWPSDLGPYRDQIDFRVLFLAYPNADLEEKAQATWDYGARHGGWAQHGLTREEVRSRMALFIDMSHDLQRECAEHGFPFVDTSYDWPAGIERAVDLVIGGATLA